MIGFVCHRLLQQLQTQQPQARCSVNVDSLPRWMMLGPLRYELWRATADIRLYCLKASYCSFNFNLISALMNLGKCLILSICPILCPVQLCGPWTVIHCPTTLCEPLAHVVEPITPELPLFSWIPSREEKAQLWLNYLILSSAVRLAGRWLTVKGVF